MAIADAKPLLVDSVKMADFQAGQGFTHQPMECGFCHKRYKSRARFKMHLAMCRSQFSTGVVDEAQSAIEEVAEISKPSGGQKLVKNRIMKPWLVTLMQPSL